MSRVPAAHVCFIDFEKNMTVRQYLALGLLAALPLAASAQQTAPMTMHHGHHHHE